MPLAGFDVLGRPAGMVMNLATVRDFPFFFFEASM